MIKVMVIDDSMAVRRGFSKLISKIAGIELLAEASNPIDAFEVFKKVGLPDLFILDIEMPKMDGITFLRKISEQRPIPVIICSTLVAQGSDAAIDALRYGAVDIIEKPKVNLEGFFSEYQDDLIEKIKAAVTANVSVKKSIDIPTNTYTKDSNVLVASQKIVAIGSSTGGVQALEKVVLGLKKGHVGVVVTQHMPEGFTASFAKRLNQIAPYSYVKEAQNDDIVKDGQVLIAPGGIHMEVYSIGGIYKVHLKDFPKVNSHKTFGESEKTAVVYGMPRVAKEMGAVDMELTIDQVANNINEII